jgi:hypothetical protein
MTLSNLYAGHYSATSYHIDASNSQSPRIQVFVSDTVSNERLQPTHADSWLSIGGVNNLTPSNILRTANSFEFWANGTDPVILRFNGTPGRSNSGKFLTPLNGIDLVLNTTLEPITLTPFALIDVGPSGQRAVTNGIGLAGAPANQINNYNYDPTALTADDGSSFTFTIDNLNTNGVTTGSIDWRDRGDSILTNELSHLGEDHVKNNSGIVRVTLGDLPKGNYRIVSYHIDASEPSGYQQCEEILVYVTDQNGNAVLQNLSGDADDTTRPFNNLTDQSIRATATAFEISSDGSNDIILYFDGTAAVDTEVPLNGLRIEKIINPNLPPVYPKGTLLIFR